MLSAKEKKILQEIREGKRQAFGRVFDEFAPKIYRFVYFKVNSREKAQDLTSEAFLKSWQYLNEGKKVDNLQALLYQIARNLVIDSYRQKSRSDILMSDLKNNQTDSSPNLEEAIEGENGDPTGAISAQQDLKKALARIKDEYREVVVLHHLEELSVREIAHILGKSEGSVRVLAHRALKELKRALKELK